MRARRWVATGFSGLDDFEFVDAVVPDPGPGEVTIEVRAAGVNPADLKHVRRESDPDKLPLPVGYEVSGVITAVGPDTRIGSGDVAIGDEVLAFRVRGGYATALTVSADTVFAKPPTLGFAEAACLLLAGSTAADMMRAARTDRDETIVLHGASGAVGVAVLQLARLRGIRVIGTASPDNLEKVRAFGGLPVPYDAPDLAARIRAVADPFRRLRRSTPWAPTTPSAPHWNWSPTGPASSRSPRPAALPPTGSWRSAVGNRRVRSSAIRCGPCLSGSHRPGICRCR